MPKSTSNTGQEWSTADDKLLKQLAAHHTPTRVIGLKLKRTPAAIYSRAAQEGISLGTKKTART
jgi:hypothetical protein